MTGRDFDSWMWAEACEALARAERLHRQFFRLGEPGPRPVWEPPVDIFENGPELWIIAALPGVAAARLEVGVENGVLVIAGERPAPALQRAAVIHRLELPQGRFERRIALPAGRFELLKREFADGCLTLVLRVFR
ncbi:MAG TPA: Hsp20/alpha crystallin family protein [Stellaceae bacterium]|nr:Hsp20/alpha crystallin family protein [Stellaceae bacterium]